MAEKAEDWQVMTAENGVQYYFNKKTNKVIWQKPDILKGEEEKKRAPSDWTEHTTADGRVFFHNAILKKSVWTRPPEMDAKPQEDTKGQGQTLAISITTNIEDDGEDEEDDDVPKKKELPIEDARRIFMNLLKEKNIDPTMKWSQIHDLLKKDDRYKVLPKISEKKKVLANYVSQIKKNERSQARTKLEQARSDYRQMLSEFKNLTSDSKYNSVVQYFFMDPRYKAIDMKERENLFQDYLDELFEKEKEDLKQHRKLMVSKMREHFLDIPLIDSSTKWEEACQLLKYNAVWQDLHDLDKIEAFSEYILTKDKEEEAQKKKARQLQERKNRQAFRELLSEKIQADELTFKTKWRSFVKKNKDDDRLVNMFRQGGSSARDIFHDYRQKLIDMSKTVKDSFKKILAKHVNDFSVNMDPLKFKKILLKYDEFKNFEGEDGCNSFEYYSNYLLDKYKKRVKKARSKFMQVVAEAFPNISPESTFEEVVAKIKENKHDAVYLSCLDDTDRKDIVNQIQTKLKAGELLESIVPLQKSKKKDKKGKDDGKIEETKDGPKKEVSTLNKRPPERTSSFSQKKGERKRSSSSGSESTHKRSRSKRSKRRPRDRSGSSHREEDGPEEGEITEIPKHLKKLMKKKGSRRRSTSSYSKSSRSKSSKSKEKPKKQSIEVEKKEE